MISATTLHSIIGLITLSLPTRDSKIKVSLTVPGLSHLPLKTKVVAVRGRKVISSSATVNTGSLGAKCFGNRPAASFPRCLASSSLAALSSIKVLLIQRRNCGLRPLFSRMIRRSKCVLVSWVPRSKVDKSSALNIVVPTPFALKGTITFSLSSMIK